MKKNLLIAAIALPLLASAQWNQVGGTVTVKSETLKYVEQDYNVTGGRTSNEGKINVRGNFAATEEATSKAGTGFHNVWTGRNAYGQLIVNSASTTSGDIDNQYNLPSNLQFQPIALPFKGYTAADVHRDTSLEANYIAYDGGDPADDGFMAGRYNASLWTWHNSTGTPGSFYFETISSGTTEMAPELYHGLNNMGSANTGTKGFIGVPNNVDKSVTANPYTMTNAWDVNEVGELYGSYVEDVAVAKPENWRMATAADTEETGVADGVAAGGYGDNISLFGNPFTSNMNLLGADGTITLTNVTHVFYIANNAYTGDGQGQSASNVYVSTFSGGAAATGAAAEDAGATMVRPQETFFVKTNGSAASLSMAEANKTFTFKTTTNVGETSRPGRTNDNGFYQVSLNLFDAEGNDTNLKSYVFASNEIQPNERSQFEAYNTTFGNLGFYSLQENADGTVYEELANQKALINGVNATDYVALPIAIGFNGEGTFTVKTNMTENLINSNNTFYFEDKEIGQIFEVVPGFEYTFVSNGNTEDRFAMYWNGLPSSLSVGDVALSAQTIVYKDSDDFKVRFAETWNQADVYVYNALGQLVHVAKKVNTANDYLIPLTGKSSAYIVKTIGDNGQVSTKKIIKK